MKTTIFIMTSLILLGIYGIYQLDKYEEQKTAYYNSLSECQKIQYHIDNSTTVFQESNALKEKEIAVLQGKCQ